MIKRDPLTLKRDEGVSYFYDNQSPTILDKLFVFFSSIVVSYNFKGGHI